MARAPWFLLVMAGLCISGNAYADEPASEKAMTAESTQQAVERALGYVHTETAIWLKNRKCAACHHAPLTVWSMNEAERQGYAIDKKFVAETVDSILGSPEKLISAKLFDDPGAPPDPRPLGKAVKISTAFMAVAAQSMPSLSDGQKQTLKVIADGIVKKQREDGSWEFFLPRPPINENETTDAVWLIMALQGEMEREPSEAQRTALAKATEWLDHTKLPDNLQDRVFKLLLAARAGQPREALQGMIDELLALQRPDGAWRQNSEMLGDAYATGQMLYVLSVAGLTADRPEMQRAINFLVTTQKPDGSWPMTSRSTPDGSPGSATNLAPITCAASSWAILGLARLVPKK